MISAFPSDATILSIHLASLRVGRSSSLQTSPINFYGTRVIFENRFGYMAKEFVDRALAGAIQLDELIKRHSMFPFFAAFLTHDASTRWLAALASGHPDAYQKFSAVTHHEFRPTHGLRQCKACVAEDEATYGTGHWHVIHQMPVIHTCPIHQQILHDTCAGCGAKFGKEAGWSLPGEACRRCGHVHTKPITHVENSEGYRALAAMIGSALNGQAQELRPEIRTLLLKSFIARSKSDPVGRLNEFLAYWKVSDLCDLNKILQCRVRDRDALKLFSDGCAMVSTSFLAAVLAYAWEKTLESERQVLLEEQKSEPRILEGMLKVRRWPEDNLREEIEVIARRFHLPNGVGRHLSSGHRTLARKLVGCVYVFLIEDALNQESRTHLMPR